MSTPISPQSLTGSGLEEGIQISRDESIEADSIRSTNGEVWMRLAPIVERQAEIVAGRFGHGERPSSLIQEAYLRIDKSPPELRTEAEMKAWVSRVIKNLAIDRQNRRQRRREVDLAPPADGDGQAADWSDPDAEDPSTQAEFEESRERLHRAISSLDPANRALLEARWPQGSDEEVKWSEVARQFQVNDSTAKMRFVRNVLPTLRQALED